MGWQVQDNELSDENYARKEELCSQDSMMTMSEQEMGDRMSQICHTYAEGAVSRKVREQALLELDGT